MYLCAPRFLFLYFFSYEGCYRDLESMGQRRMNLDDEMHFKDASPVVGNSHWREGGRSVLAWVIEREI